MQLISIQFAAFWAGALLLYYLAPKYRAYVLLGISLICFWLFSRGLPLLVIAAALVSWLCGRILEKKRSIAVPVLAVLVDAAVLILFRHALPAVSFDGEEAIGFLFPALGLSYYLLSALSYCLDVYKGKIEPEKNFFRLLLFLSYFPALYQGPLNRYDALSKELFAEHRFSYRTFCFGVQRAMFGVLKKLLIVPRLMWYTDAVYGNLEEAVLPRFLLASLMFALSLYLDWTGYMDIILGVSETFGVRLPENFRQPYFSRSPSEFWKRWHFTLGEWFRDYVYIPMGGSRHGLARQALALFTVWILTGLWHGAGAGYLAWGLWHGAILFLCVLWKRKRGVEGRLKLLPIAGTFLVAILGWIPFRLQDLEGLKGFFGAITTGSFYQLPQGESLWNTCYTGIDTGVLLVLLFLVAVISVLHEKGRSVREMIGKLVLPARWAIWLFLFFSVLIFGVYGVDYDAAAFVYQLF